MQKISFIGNLTRDPEMRTTPAGVSVCSFTVAVNRKFKNANGEQVTDFFRVSAWRQLAEICVKYLSKGKKVFVVGELQPRTYEAKDGTIKTSLDVQSDEVEFLTPKSATENETQPSVDTSATEINQEDIPF